MKKLLCLLTVLIFSFVPCCAKDLRFVQISDVRFSAGSNNALSSVIRDVNKLKDVDFVVFTGDNIENPSTENLLAFLNSAKKLKYPYYIVLGDKDVNKHKNLSKKQYAKLLKKHIRCYKPETTNYVFAKKGVVFFVLDGTKDVIPSTNGYYKDDVLEWFDANLDLYPNKNIFIFQHFPVVQPTNNENYMTFKPEGYLAILEKHKNIKAIFSGHYGVNDEKNVDGVVHITTAPIPQYRIIDIIDVDTKNPTVWAEVKTAE